MDALIEIVKAVVAVVGLVVILLLIPVLWMFIFDLARGIDRRMER